MQRNCSVRRALSFLSTPFGRGKQKLSVLQDRSAPQKYSTRKAQGKSIDINDAAHPFYNYTSGRWLYNEHLRLAERRLHFNIDELCRVVAKSVGQSSDDIILFTKIAEGGSYRIFEATFRNGLKAIARLPYPCTIPHKYGVASEVATMEFLRLHGVPVPKVLDWSSSANQVGSEYIVMEKVPGKELADIWYTMTLRERMKIMEQIVDMERILFNLRFPASGSLFFKDSVEASFKTVDVRKVANLKGIERFCIGPSVEYLWWYQKRNELAVNHGPCMYYTLASTIHWLLNKKPLGQRTEELLTAVGEREILWLQRFGEKRYPHEPLYREIYENQKVDPQVQINYLRDYLKVVPHIVPKDEQLNTPTLRHPDLSPNNILISDSGDITGIIDWQRTVILPRFLHANIPKHFQNYGDDDSENFRPPKLADNYDSMTESEQETEMELYRRRQVHYFYVGYTSRLNKAHFDVMGKYNLVLRHRLYDVAMQPWEGNNTSLQAELIKIIADWPEIAAPDVEPLIHYTSAEVDECLQRDTKQKEADDEMQQTRDCMGINIEGWVPNDGFETVRENAKQMRSAAWKAAETEKERMEFEALWPFQDHEEID